MLTLIVFFVVLSILVLVHEYGHYIVGKKSGIGVLEFALGLPFTKPLWSKKLSSGMRLSLYPILFGGFVKLLGEDQQSSGIKEEEHVKGKHFYAAPVWTRIAVVVAGVLMNLILGVAAFYLFLILSNFRALVPRLSEYRFASPSQEAIVVTRVVSGSPAQQAGLKAENVILSVDGNSFKDIPDFQKYIKSRAGSEVTMRTTNLEYGAEQEVRVIPRMNPPKNEGALGIGIGEAIAVKFDTPVEKLSSGISYSYDMVVYNVKVLSSLISQSAKTGNAAPVADNVSGPVGIIKAIGDILGLGSLMLIIKALLNFLGVLSLSLAFMNILPIPAMDGGRLAFLLVEAFTTKKLASKYENWINQAGMILLLGLIVLITFNDIKKNFLPSCDDKGFMSEAGLCVQNEVVK